MYPCETCLLDVVCKEACDWFDPDILTTKVLPEKYYVRAASKPEKVNSHPTIRCTKKDYRNVIIDVKNPPLSVRVDITVPEVITVFGGATPDFPEYQIVPRFQLRTSNVTIRTDYYTKEKFYVGKSFTINQLGKRIWIDHKDLGKISLFLTPSKAPSVVIGHELDTELVTGGRRVGLKGGFSTPSEQGRSVKITHRKRIHISEEKDRRLSSVSLQHYEHRHGDNATLIWDNYFETRTNGKVKRVYYNGVYSEEP